MTTIELRVDPGVLENPDADLRYLIPETIEARSDGMIRSDGYDYEGDRPVMVIFLVAEDVSTALELIRAVLDSEVLLGNRLRGKYELSVAEPSS
jgi:hypothetical protein